MRLIDAHHVEPKTIRVFLDGKDVSNFVTVAYVPLQSDVDGKGWVDMMQCDEHGFVLTDESGVDPLLKRVKGRVRWELV